MGTNLHRPRDDVAVDRQGWNQRYEGRELLWSARANRFLTAAAAEIAPGRALDVACGEGRNAVWLAERGWQVTGIDFSDVGLGKAAELAEQRGVTVEWVCADLHEYAPPAEAFDLVAILYLHLSADGRRRVLEQAARAVAPDGVLLVVGHDASNPADGYGGPQDPAILFTPDAVAAELPGLSVQRAERVLRPVATLQGEVHAIDAIVRATKGPRS